MSLRYWGGGNNGENGRGISTQTALIVAGAVIALVVFCLSVCLCWRRKKSQQRFRDHPHPVLPTNNMSQLPPPPAAYIRPTSGNDLPAYRPPQGAPPSGPHSAWAPPAPPYKPRTPPPTTPPPAPNPPNPSAPSPPPASATNPIVSSPPNRRSIFRRPVPPLHTSDDLAPPPSPIPGAQPQLLPQVTPYERRRGENPFGARGIDERHPGAPESEAGDTGLERSGTASKALGAPPGYMEAVGRS